MSQSKGRSYERSDQLLLITTAVMIAAALVLGRQFANPDNFRVLLISFVSIGFISLGMMALLISGVFDLSVGSIFAIGVVSVAIFMTDLGMPWPVACGATLLVCGACGAGNGFLVTKMKINPLIATLGMMAILRGAAFLVGGTGRSGLPAGFKALGNMTFLGLILPVWIFIGTVFLFMFMFRYLKYFRKFYFVGGNKDAARLSGINVDRIWFSGFVIMGLLAGLAGILYCARLGSSVAQAGTGMEMRVIAGVVIGGASINGGKGTILGGVMGALFMALVFNIMGIGDVPGNWQRIVTGVILILAVFTDVVVEQGYLSKLVKKLKSSVR